MHSLVIVQLQCLLLRFPFEQTRQLSKVIRNTPMNVRGKVYNTAPATVQLSFKPTIDKTENLWTYICTNGILE